MSAPVAPTPRPRRRHRAILTLGVAGLLPLLAATLFVAWPIPATTLAPPDRAGLTLTDRTGAVLRTTRAGDGQHRRWLALDAIDPLLPAAFIALEDRTFLAHHGVAWRALLRATRDNLLAGRVVSGASTITMQLARLLSGAARGPAGKVEQLLWALRLEAHLDKRTILEQYLNRVPLGQGTIGVDAAARRYLGTSAAQLSPAGAALLAALARAPARDNPLHDPMRADRARRRALDRLVRDGLVTADAAQLAREEPLLVPPRATSQPLAPHFIARVLGWLDDGTATGDIRTTLDLALQRDAEDDVREAIRALAAHGARDAAAVILDNATGDVLAWVGSPDFWRPDRDATGRRTGAGGQVDMVVGRRQPGSALKPFVYALAFDQGFSPATVLADLPRTFQTSTGSYAPRNYDRRAHGPVRARDALASSYNIPAVLVTHQLGVPALHRTLHAAGFASLDRPAEHYGLGLALGNGEVTLIELANAYRALVNGGEHRPWRWQAPTAATPTPASFSATIGRDAADDTSRPRTRERTGDTTRVVSARAAAQVLDILADPAARLAGFGEQTPFDFPFPVAVKTGTSRHFTDNWAVATTGGFTVAVWVGNFDGTPMQAVSGISGAGPLLRRLVWRTAARVAPGTLPAPAAAGAARVRICRLSGHRATAECPQLDEWLTPAQAAALTPCDWHLAGGGVRWPGEYRQWAEQMGRALRVAEAQRDAGAALAGEAAAQGSDRVHPTAPTTAGPRTARADPAPSASEAALRIESPRDGDRFELPLGEAARFATIPLRVAGPATDLVRWYIDGQPHHAPRWRLAPGAHVIRAERGRARAEARIQVEPGSR